MNPLRIFARLRDLERVAHEPVDVRVVAAEVARTIVEAVIAAHNKKFGICARCGSRVHIAVTREDGPRVMEKTIEGKTTYLLVCHECEPYVKRDDWKRARPRITNPEGATA